VTGDLVRRIRQLRPHVVLTFGTDGGLTGHVDHAMVSLFTTTAFQWAGRPDRYPEQLNDGLQPHRAQKLYHLAADFLLPNRPPIAPPTVTARIDIGAERLHKKIEAFTQHTTQAPLFDLVRENISRPGAVEMFHLVATRDPREAKYETDLFEAVLED
jgi:LmbE family N-acetylglucosaminyl deacetylase